MFVPFYRYLLFEFLELQIFKMDVHVVPTVFFSGSHSFETVCL